MSRIKRIVAVGYPHHITQRGNYQQTIFTTTVEYIKYLKWFDEYAKKYYLSILAYCLMPNHVHFVAIPEKEYSLAKTFNTSHMRYAQYLNKKNNLIGHLWQGRFFSCVLDEIYLYATVRYIENNPVRANLVKDTEEWRWSSALAHLNKGVSILPLSDISTYIEVTNWKDYLLEKEDNSIISNLKSNTLNGKPLGNDMFILKLEKLLGRHINKFPLGRPRKC